ncbi:MAG TPA: ATP-binding protein [Verrucomicrobiae bacterium]|nr:ATP-binding protein [Verrucomicrobiae bacterium]
MNLSLPWKWFFGLAVLLVDLLLVVYVAIRITLPPYLVQQIRGDLKRDAIVVRDVFAARLAASQPNLADINHLCHDLSKESGLRITVIASDGTVIGESDKPESELKNIENHLARPEVQQAIHEGVGSTTRHSHTIGVDLLYVAVPVRNDKLDGIVRVALPLVEIRHTTAHVLRTVAVSGIVVGLAAIPLLFWMSRRVTRPILQMREVAARVARGDFSQKAPTRVTGELSELAAALNNMSTQLETRLRELGEEKAELSGILAGMTEGVLVVGTDGKVRLTNRALQRQFGISLEASGKTVLEAFRNVSLQELVTEVVQKGDVSDRELTFLTPNERAYELSATRLQGHDGAFTGAVIVFHDITRMRQFENTRREFVANVSHELRTPLSIIKGYVETLLDSQPPDPATAKQFLQTIQRHSQRLEALIGDLLSISALESQQARLNLEPISLRAAAQSVVNELARQAQKKSTTVSLEIPEQLPAARADAQRLHQVLFNLLDNAVKYTQVGSGVTIAAYEKDGVIEAAVGDNGPGIAPEHLPHIFERFYRVDKARSRELGGTGLGLSIVKHIVQAHGGRVWAESQLEKGSTFYFTLPRA